MVLLSRKLIWSMGKAQVLAGFILAKIWQIFQRLISGMALTVQPLTVRKPFFPLSVFLPKYVEKIASQ